MGAPKIVVAGSINIDLVVDLPVLPKPNETLIGGELQVAVGGKGHNQAVALARLGCETYFIGAVGDDDHGAKALAHFKDAGVDTKFVACRKNATGTALILVGADGQNMIAVSPGANAAVTPKDIKAAEDLIASADALVVQLELPLKTVEAALSAARRHNVRTILNPAPAIDGAMSLMPLADIVTPNELELASLTGIDDQSDPALHAALHSLKKAGAGLPVATLGLNGCAALIEGSLVRVPAFRVKAIDATGAGDVFNGALAAYLSKENDLVAGLRFASAAAALSVSRASADAAPKFAEIEAFLKSAPALA
jgi:ribokinase